MAKTQSERLDEVPSLTVTTERLVFASGAQCDLLHLDGTLPFDQEVRGYRARLTTRGELVIGGVSQGENGRASNAIGSSSSVGTHDLRRFVLVAQVYVPDEAGTLPDSVEIPEPWRNQPYTSTFTRTTLGLTLRGKVGTRKTFAVTAATRDAAKRRLARDLELSANATDRHAARKIFRLALRGVRLEMKSFTARWSGELTR